MVLGVQLAIPFLLVVVGVCHPIVNIPFLLDDAGKQPHFILLIFMILVV